MTSKETYNYLGGWFAEGMRKAYAESYGKKATKHKELQGYGQFGDFKPNHYRLSRCLLRLRRLLAMM